MSGNGVAATIGGVSGVATGPTLDQKIAGERLELAAGGAWTVEHAHALEPLVEAASGGGQSVRRVSIDMGRVDRLDTFGAWLIERLMRAWRSAGLEASVVGLADDYRGLLQEIHNVNRAGPAASQER